jgi:hypothetical protein
VRDNPSTCAGNACGTGTVVSTDYSPNTLFYTREGTFRDVCPGGNCNSTQPMLNGVVGYTELDVNNLSRWLTGAIGANGSLSKDPVNGTNDFVVYFSDRRGNYTATPVAGWPAPSPSKNETGEFGFQDFINRASQFACPDGVLDAAETLDVTENSYGQQTGGTPQNYGASSPSNGVDPFYPQMLNGVAGVAIANNPNCAAPATVWPGWFATTAMEARENVPVFFRRALKIVNGSSINLGACPAGVPCGLNIVSENPVYVQGQFNAGSGGNFDGPHVGTAVIADAVTLLSDNWNDVNSFAFPYSLGGRKASSDNLSLRGYRRKALPFPARRLRHLPGLWHRWWRAQFLRYLENWGGQTLYYRGSLVSFYYNRQATGVFKCCATVYSPPSRAYTFDSDFLT